MKGLCKSESQRDDGGGRAEMGLGLSGEDDNGNG